MNKQEMIAEALAQADKIDEDYRRATEGTALAGLPGRTSRIIRGLVSLIEEQSAAAQPADELAYIEACNLAKAIHAQHYREDSPQWQVLPDLRGVISQINNMTAGMTRAGAQPAAPIQSEREAFEQRGKELFGQQFEAMKGTFWLFWQDARAALSQPAPAGQPQMPTVQVGDYRIPVPPVDHWSNPNAASAVQPAAPIQSGREALQQIADMTPDTSEMTLAHQMGQIAIDALSQPAPAPVKWDRQSAMTVMQMLGDGSFGMTDVLATVELLQAAEKVRPNLVDFSAQPAPAGQPQKTVAWLATDLDGSGDVALTRIEAKRRAGEHCKHLQALVFADAVQAAPQAAGNRGNAIARSQRILALVDDWHEKPTRDARTALRIALMDEFEADAQAEWFKTPRDAIRAAIAKEST